MKNMYLFCVDLLWQNPSARITCESWKVIKKTILLKEGSGLSGKLQSS